MSANPVLDLAVMYAKVGHQLVSARTTDDTFSAILAAAIQTVDGVEAASITQRRSGRFSTVASTDDRCLIADQIQYDLGTGPCVDAINEPAVIRVDDLSTDTRWDEYGPRASSELGVRSMLSHRLFLESDSVAAGLNMYSTETKAFGESSEIMATVLATHAAVTLSAALARDHAENLRAALISNREIGIATGVLMNAHNLSKDQAFDLLRIASQHRNRKIADIARRVAQTGELRLPSGDDAASWPDEQ